MALACIAIGSNLGDRAAAFAHARRGLDGLPASRLVAFARAIETKAVGPGVQGAYLNGAATVETELGARELLDHLLRIERDAGRDRSAEERWGARTLDLDLLLLGGQVLDEPGLRVPHPRMHERRFVLEPLATIAAGVVHPLLGLTVGELLDALDRGRAYAEP